MDFNSVFTDRFRTEWRMRQYELHPPHLMLLHYLVEVKTAKMLDANLF